MNKFFISVALLVLSIPAFSSQITCRSAKNAPAYYAREGQWILNFDLQDIDGDILTDFSLKNKNVVDLGSQNETVSPDAKFKAKNPAFKDFNRYQISDAWANYNILLPKGLNEIEDSFDGLIYWIGEENSGGSFKIFCHKN